MEPMQMARQLTPARQNSSSRMQLEQQLACLTAKATSSCSSCCWTSIMIERKYWSSKMLQKPLLPLLLPAV
jgi:hypothetical protein